MNLDDVSAYLQVVASGSLSQAARALNRPKASVSHQIRRLENELDTPLFVRGANQMVLSEAGQQFYDHALAIRRACERGRDATQDSRARAAGRIDIATTSEFTSNFATPVLLHFVGDHPELEVRVMVSSRPGLEEMREQYDCILYLGDPPLPQFANMSARLLGRFHFGLFASEGYLKRYGIPERPKDLLQSRLVGFHDGTAAATWQMTNGVEDFSLRPDTKMLSNDYWVVKLSAIHDHGICFVPTFFAVQEESAGLLKRVLPAWASPEIPVFALFWSHRFANPNLRALLESLVTHFDEINHYLYTASRSDRLRGPGRDARAEKLE
jgi:DNA-binding transcriptional LysR family regulator